VVRVTRRYHVIDRISRRLGSLGGGSSSGPPEAVNGNVHHHPGNGGTVEAAAVTNGHGHHHHRTNGCQQSPPQRPESRVPPLHGEPTVVLRTAEPLNGRQAPQPPPSAQPTTRLGRYSRYLNGDSRSNGHGHGLEKQLLLQQAEICSLREGII
jgi:hypothetical protein